MSAPTYVAGKSGKWHIARYEPRGYGVAALCGKVWNQGDFERLHSDVDTDIDLCLSCERKHRSRERGGE